MSYRIFNTFLFLIGFIAALFYFFYSHLIYTIPQGYAYPILIVSLVLIASFFRLLIKRQRKDYPKTTGTSIKLRYADMYPVLWNQYTLLYDTLKSAEKRIDFLLVFTSIVLTVLFSSFIVKLNAIPWLYFPIGGYLIVLLLLLIGYTLPLKDLGFPYIDLEELSGFNNLEEFYKRKIDHMFGNSPYDNEGSSSILDNRRLLQQISILSIVILLMSSYSIGLWFIKDNWLLLFSSFPIFTFLIYRIIIYLNVNFIINSVRTYIGTLKNMTFASPQEDAEMISRTKKDATSSASSIINRIGFILTIFSIVLSFALAEAANIHSWYEINETSEKLTVFIKNDARFKETGVINFYRLEISDSKPHVQFKSLRPREELNYTFQIKISNISLEDSVSNTSTGVAFSPPFHKLYFVDNLSITYKITCDNCYSQGAVRRIPQFSTVEIVSGVGRSIDGKLFLHPYAPMYQWVDYKIKDL